MKASIERNLQRCLFEADRLNRFIEQVEDSEMRMILAYRNVNGLNWRQVAALIDPNLSADCVRKMYDRYLKTTEA